MDKSNLLKLNNTRESLNNLIGKNLNGLTNSEVVKLSQELDKLIVARQIEINKEKARLN